MVAQTWESRYNPSRISQRSIIIGGWHTSRLSHLHVCKQIEDDQEEEFQTKPFNGSSQKQDTGRETHSKSDSDLTN